MGRAAAVLGLAIGMSWLGGCVTSDPRLDEAIMGTYGGTLGRPEAKLKVGESPQQMASVVSYVNSVGNRVERAASGLDAGDARFFVLADGNSAEHFGFPDYTSKGKVTGYNVYVTRGFLEEIENDAQLASVLGLELALLSAKHIERALSSHESGNFFGDLWNGIVKLLDSSSTEQRDQQTLQALKDAAVVDTDGTFGMTYTEDDLEAADRLVVDWLIAAGFDPVSYIDGLEEISAAAASGSRQVGVSTASEARLESIDRYIKSKDLDDPPAADAAGYRQSVLVPLGVVE